MVRSKMRNASANGLGCTGKIRASVALYNDLTTNSILLICEGESEEGLHIKLLLYGGMYV